MNTVVAALQPFLSTIRAGYVRCTHQWSRALKYNYPNVVDDTPATHHLPLQNITLSNGTIPFNVNVQYADNQLTITWDAPTTTDSLHSGNLYLAILNPQNNRLLQLHFPLADAHATIPLTPLYPQTLTPTKSTTSTTPDDDPNTLHLYTFAATTSRSTSTTHTPINPTNTPVNSTPDNTTQPTDTPATPSETDTHGTTSTLNSSPTSTAPSLHLNLPHPILQHLDTQHLRIIRQNPLCHTRPLHKTITPRVEILLKTHPKRLTHILKPIQIKVIHSTAVRQLIIIDNSKRRTIHHPLHPQILAYRLHQRSLPSPHRPVHSHNTAPTYRLQYPWHHTRHVLHTPYNKLIHHYSILYRQITKSLPILNHKQRHAHSHNATGAPSISNPSTSLSSTHLSNSSHRQSYLLSSTHNVYPRIYTSATQAQI